MCDRISLCHLIVVERRIEALVVQAPGCHVRSEEVTDKGSSSDDEGDALVESTTDHGTAQAGQDGQVKGSDKDALLSHVDAALESNAALSSKLYGIIEHVRFKCMQYVRSRLSCGRNTRHKTRFYAGPAPDSRERCNSFKHQSGTIR